MKDIIKLVISIVICQLAGVIGSFFTTPAIATWYADLVKPSFSLPNWIFAPVWITLFMLMGISLSFVWREGARRPQVKLALIVFSIQLVLNILWSILFFGLKLPLIAFFEIIALWISILLMILTFLRVSIIAGLLQIPYILWVSFAGFLNFMLWKLNS